MTPLENQKSRFNVRLKKRVSDDGPAILAAPAPGCSTEGVAGLSAKQLLSRFNIRLKKRVSDDSPAIRLAILAAPAPVSSTESIAMTPFDIAIENQMNLILDARQIRSLPTTMADGGGDLIKAITNCEGA